MIRSKQTGLLLGVAALLAAPAQAQWTKAIAEGDVLSNGTVTSISECDINNFGDWIVECDTDAGSTMDNAVVFNGTELFLEGTNLNFPASHSTDWVLGGTVQVISVNDNGEVMALLNADNPMAGITNRRMLYWRSAGGTGYILLEQDVSPNTGDPDQTGSPLWDSIAQAWQNDNNQIVVAGRSTTDSDDMMVILTHDGMGAITSAVTFVIDGVVHSTFDPMATGTHLDTVQTLGASKFNFALNDSGQKFFFVDDQSFGPGGTPDWTDVDSHYYLDSTEIAWEMDLGPNGIDTWNHLSSAEVDLNSSGQWAAIWDDDGTIAEDFYVMNNGAVVINEGDAPPGIPTPMTGPIAITGMFGALHLTDGGDVVYQLDWDDPDTSRDTGLFMNNDTVLAQEGVTMIGSVTIGQLTTSVDVRAVSDNGRFIIQEFTLNDASTTEGAYILDLTSNNIVPYCFGDGGDQMGCTNCPCGNNAAPGTEGGCLNSASRSAELVGSGNPEVGGDTLRFEVLGAASSTFGVLVSADNQLPNMGACPVGSGLQAFDGLRCVGGGLLRHGTRATDANGDIGATNNAWGPPNGPAGGLIANGGFMTGQTRHFQCFYREDVTLGCLTGQNTTNAVSVTFL